MDLLVVHLMFTMIQLKTWNYAEGNGNIWIAFSTAVAVAFPDVCLRANSAMQRFAEMMENDAQ